MFVDCRDLTVPTYSVSCSTGFGFRVTISTAIAGIAPRLGAAPPPPAAELPPPHDAEVTAKRRAPTTVRVVIDLKLDAGRRRRVRNGSRQDRRTRQGRFTSQGRYTMMMRGGRMRQYVLCSPFDPFVKVPRHAADLPSQRQHDRACQHLRRSILRRCLDRSVVPDR